MFKQLLCLLVVTISCQFLIAQDKTCGSSEAINEAFKNNPELRENLLQLENFTQNFEYNQAEAGNPKIIPVVVHIIHNYSSENISKAQVENALEILNEDFRKLNSDTTDIIPEFSSIAADSEIEFRLAKIAPDNSCTDGITRTVSELTFNANNNVKDLISWPTDKYFNIWVVDNISFGAGGYAYYPGTAPKASYEGVVVTHQQFGGIGTSGGSNFARRTLTHEAGHYFNLPHTWGSTNNVNVPSNCSSDDGVSDTPNCQGTPQSCDLGRNTCNSLDNVQNYMDYANCTKMFTEGQKTRMQAALASSAGNRDKLWQNSNLIATGTNDGYQSTCVPIADFFTYTKVVCAGDNIKFYDVSYNASVDTTWDWNWTFSGGIPNTSTNQNPTITYTSPGIYPVILSVTNSEGTDVVTKTQYVEVRSTIPVYNTPYIEQMEAATFPTNTGEPEKTWKIETDISSTASWQKHPTTGTSGFHSMYIDNSGIGPNLRNSFVSPVIDYSNVPSNTANLTFWLAYAQTSFSDSERLIVYVSKNCGRTWQVRYSKQGSDLVTNGGGLVSGDFTPNYGKWRQETVNLIGYQSESNLKFKFECVSGGGDRVYIDDINFALYPTSIDKNEEKETVKVFPNPSSGILNVEISSTENRTFSLTNQLGQIVYRQNLLSQRENIDLKHLPDGIYFWNISNHNQEISKGKVVLSK